MDIVFMVFFYGLFAVGCTALVAVLGLGIYRKLRHVETDTDVLHDEPLREGQIRLPGAGNAAGLGHGML